MRTTTLGSTGPEVGVIGLGCMGMTFSYDMETPRDDATSMSVIHQALGLGMTLIDTADAYGPYTNEELASARPASSSVVYGPYASAVSISVMPRSSARWMTEIEVASSRGVSMS